VPEAAFYDDDEAQRENGVGLVRALLDDWQHIRARARPSPRHVGRATLVCGVLIAPILRELAVELQQRSGVELQVVAAANDLFGESVTVSGLLAGEDVLAALAGRDLGEVVFLPRVMFDATGHLTLDDLTPEILSARLGVRVLLVNTLSEVLAGLKPLRNEPTERR
jgi:NifB/MoaA-like Fe-S oxidoreductase